MNARQIANGTSLMKIIARRWVASVQDADDGAVIITLADDWHFRTDRAPTRTFATLAAADRGTRKNIVAVRDL